MRWFPSLLLTLALGVTGCTQASGTDGTAGSGGEGGVCTPGAGGIGGDPMQCDSDEGCDDGKPCTTDVCDLWSYDGTPQGQCFSACENTPLENGIACSGGECLDGVCAPVGAFPCTEEGVRDALENGGGPHYFACDGATTVTTRDEIVIDKDVVLDGEGHLTLDGDDTHGVLSIAEGATVALYRMTVTRGRRESEGHGGGAIANEGTLLLDHCIVSNSYTDPDGASSQGGGGIWNAGQMEIRFSAILGNRTVHSEGGGVYNARGGTLSLRDSIVADNRPQMDGAATVGGGISNYGEMSIANSTVSENVLGSEGNSGAGIVNYGRLSLVSSTITGNRSDFGEEAIESGFRQPSDPEPRVEIAGTVIDGKCTYSGVTELVSNGHNVESEQDTCGLDRESDQVNVSAEKLALGPLQDNGGPTMTHALGEGSVAIDQIPAAECVDVDGELLTTDQRGFPRDAMCDTGAFEVQP